MTKIPCKDCICFPVCQAQVINYIMENINKYKPIKYERMNLTYYIYQDVLTFKCSIIKDWVHTHKFIKCLDYIEELFFIKQYLEGGYNEQNNMSM